MNARLERALAFVATVLLYFFTGVLGFVIIVIVAGIFS
jgi:hypothetical protein